MAKQIKKIKVKKPRQPRQRRPPVARKPPVTNVTVHIGGGLQDLAGTHYFPNQPVQSQLNNIFTPASTRLRPPVLEEPALQPFDVITPPVRESVEIATQTESKKPKLKLVMDTGSQTQISVPPMISPLLPQPPPPSPILSAGGRGRRASEFTTSNKSLAQLREMGNKLGIYTEGKTLKVLKSEIDYIKRKGI